MHSNSLSLTLCASCSVDWKSVQHCSSWRAINQGNYVRCGWFIHEMLVLRVEPWTASRLRADISVHWKIRREIFSMRPIEKLFGDCLTRSKLVLWKKNMAKRITDNSLLSLMHENICIWQKANSIFFRLFLFLYQCISFASKQNRVYFSRDIFCLQCSLVKNPIRQKHVSDDFSSTNYPRFLCVSQFANCEKCNVKYLHLEIHLGVFKFLWKPDRGKLTI